MDHFLIWLCVGIGIVVVSLLGARLGGPVWEVVRSTRGVGFVLLLGILLFFFTAQGQEILVVAADGRACSTCRSPSACWASGSFSWRACLCCRVYSPSSHI